jgi:DNA-binding beta-propeller fold protein YncE
MIFSGARGLLFGRRLRRRGLPVLLSAASVLLWAAPGADAANRIYWGDSNSTVISFAHLDGTGHGGNLKTTGVTPDQPSGLAMDLLHGKLYWADFGANEISFARLNDTGGGGHLKTTGASTPSRPVGVATDPASGRIYWADATISGPISFAKLDDTGGGHDVSGATVEFPDGVAIDPATGKIYWASTSGKISFADLNGSGGGDLNTTGATVSTPVGVAIDPANGKIYWANATDNTHPISFAKLNNTGGGGDLKVTGATPSNANGVAIDPKGGKIYWGNYNAGMPGGTISFANLNDTGGGGELDTTGASNPVGPAFPALLKKPLATAQPKISGGSTVGSKLTCSKGKWATDLVESFLYQRPVSFTYRWSRNGKPVAGAIANVYTAFGAGTYTCTVTAKNQAGSTKQTSATHKIS